MEEISHDLSSTKSLGVALGIKSMHLEGDRMEGGAALNLLGGLIYDEEGECHTAINPEIARGSSPRARRPQRPTSRPQRRNSNPDFDTNPFINGAGVNPFTDMGTDGAGAAWVPDTVADCPPPLPRPRLASAAVDPLPDLADDAMRTADGGWNPALLSLSIKDIHAFISARNLSPDDAKDLKVHRRRVMNRMYTKLSRQRRGSGTSGAGKKNAGSAKRPGPDNDKATVWEYAVSLSSISQRARKK